MPNIRKKSVRRPVKKSVRRPVKKSVRRSVKKSSRRSVKKLLRKQKKLKGGSRERASRNRKRREEERKESANKELERQKKYKIDKERDLLQDSKCGYGGGRWGHKEKNGRCVDCQSMFARLL